MSKETLDLMEYGRKAHEALLAAPRESLGPAARRLLGLRRWDEWVAEKLPRLGGRLLTEAEFDDLLARLERPDGELRMDWAFRDAD